jgi:hypothetical protein
MRSAEICCYPVISHKQKLVAGIRAVTAGYKIWVIEPLYDGFDLTGTSARVSYKIRWYISEMGVK